MSNIMTRLCSIEQQFSLILHLAACQVYFRCVARSESTLPEIMTGCTGRIRQIPSIFHGVLTTKKMTCHEWCMSARYFLHLLVLVLMGTASVLIGLSVDRCNPDHLGAALGMVLVSLILLFLLLMMYVERENEIVAAMFRNLV